MKMKLNQNMVLPIASMIAIFGLVAFQLAWMHYSRHLSDEIFNQRACMALCSTVEKCGSGVQCTPDGSIATCNTTGEVTTSPVLTSDSSFHKELRKTLDFYQIDLDYTLTLSPEKTGNQMAQTPQCAVAIPMDAGDSKAYLNLNFPSKQAFLLGKINFMVIATVLILLFTAAVLLFANWLLHKQKRLLQTNIDFFNNMAHEFRTPLTNVGLAANMISKKHYALKDEPLMDIIQKENTKLLAQVERVLHLASLENGDYPLEKERLPLRALLISVRDEMAIQMEERQATVDLDSIPQHLEVFGDRLHLGNVFRNLLDNALKYNENQPHIQIFAQSNPKGITISVQDNGIGIPSDQSELIFEKFQRANQGDLHDQKGFGLGLAYVKCMVELHKGFINVTTTIQAGTRFDVFLPTIASAK